MDSVLVSCLLILCSLSFVGLSIIWINYLVSKRKRKVEERPEEPEVSEEIRKILKGENK